MQRNSFGAFDIESKKKEQSDKQIEPNWLRYRTIFGCVILLPSALIAGGFVGCSSNWLATENELVKACW